MQILVTGGAGYIGSVLTPLLLRLGHRVRVLDSLRHGVQSLLGVWSDPGFEFVRGDLRDDAAVAAAVHGCDAVVHLAAIVGDPACARDPDTARAVNYDASLRLIEHARRAGVERFVFASTCSNYGRMADPDRLVDEESPLRPVSLYAETKVAVEEALRRLGPDDPLCATPLRFATVYGVSPRMRFDLTVNEFTLALLAEGRLSVYGEQFWRPYVHVRDVARAVATVLAAPREVVAAEVFNVGSTDANYRKADLVELIRPMAPDATVEFVHRDEDPRDYRVSFTRIRERLGFEVTRSVPDGVAEVAALVRSGMAAEPAGAGA